MASPHRQNGSPCELFGKITPIARSNSDIASPTPLKDSFFSQSTPKSLSRSRVDQVPTPLRQQRSETKTRSLPGWSVDDFEVGKTVGRGNFGVVRLAREKTTGFVCALKTISKRRVLRLKVHNHLQREIEIQGHLHHPNVLRLLGAFWDNSCIHLCLEFAPQGNLYQYMRRQPEERLEDSLAAAFMMQLVEALAHCHRAHVMHRDIKPENALIGNGMKLKVCDFGWAAHTDPNVKRWTLCGTLDYLPPEMVRSENGHSFEVDPWSLGVLAFELITGKPPFLSRSRSETYRQILAADVVFPDDFSEGARSFITRMIQQRPSDRSSLEEVRTHPWFMSISAKPGASSGIADLSEVTLT